MRMNSSGLGWGPTAIVRGPGGGAPAACGDRPDQAAAVEPSATEVRKSRRLMSVAFTGASCVDSFAAPLLGRHSASRATPRAWRQVVRAWVWSHRLHPLPVAQPMASRWQVRPHFLHQCIETLGLRDVQLAALFDASISALDLVNGNQLSAYSYWRIFQRLGPALASGQLLVNFTVENNRQAYPGQDHFAPVWPPQRL